MSLPVLRLLLVPQVELRSDLNVVSSCFILPLRLTTGDAYSSLWTAQALKHTLLLT